MSALQFRLEETLRQATSTGIAPAVALAMSRGYQPAKTMYFGHTRPEKDTIADGQTVFDLASLTKPMSTTLWALTLADAGRLDLHKEIGHYLPVADPHIRAQPVLSLMNHTSGWRPFRQYFKGLGRVHMNHSERKAAKESIRRMLARDTPEPQPGKIEIYSDIGYLALEWICELVDTSWSQAWHTLPFHGQDTIHFPDMNNQDNPVYAATENCSWRKTMIQGVVHDDNAWTMGGVCGHAGAFGTLKDVHALARHWMQASNGQIHQLGVDAELIQFALNPTHMSPRGSRVLGWDTPSPGMSSSGRFFGRRSFGHLGFTGTSVWIDPDAEIVVTLLTNRVCPTRNNPKIRSFRPHVHDLAFKYMSDKDS